MLPLPSDESEAHARLLARILRTLRRRRGLSAKEVAGRMGLPKRTYELFEAGTGRLSLPRLQSFAEATDTDAYAILIGLAFGDLAFAIRCADNKLMTAAVMSLEDLNREAGDDLALLDPRSVIRAMDTACEALLAEARARRLPPRPSPG